MSKNWRFIRTANEYFVAPKEVIQQKGQSERELEREKERGKEEKEEKEDRKVTLFHPQTLRVVLLLLHLSSCST